MARLASAGDGRRVFQPPRRGSADQGSRDPPFPGKSRAAPLPGLSKTQDVRIAGTSPDFGTERQSDSGGEGSAVVLAGANGDGSADLVVSNTDDRASLCGIGEIAVLLNDGDGAVMPPVVTPFASAIPPTP